MAATKRVTTFAVNAVALAGDTALDVSWPVGTQIVGVMHDDAAPWVLQLILEYPVPDDLTTEMLPGEHRCIRGYRSTQRRDHDIPIPTDASWLGTVLDGPSGPLHIYEVNPVTSHYCRRCKCAIKWVRMETTGKAMPIDPFPDPDTGTVAVRQVGPGRLEGYVVSKAHPLQDGYQLYRNHVQLCREIADPPAASGGRISLLDVDDQLDDDSPVAPRKLPLTRIVDGGAA